MKKEIIITGCYHSCKFFNVSSDGMECGHPYWDNKSSYENLIITQENSRDGNIPNKCPLKQNDLEIIYKLKL